MKFPKKQAQRLIPEYLLDYTTKLNESHPDPTQSWGGGSGGSEYNAGDGIDITNNVISVDNTIAKKSDIPSLDGYATQTWVQEQGYKTSITSSDVTNALGYTPGTSNFSGSYNELTDTPDLSIYAQSSNLSTVATTGSYNDLLDKPTIPDTTNLVTTDTNQTITGAKTFQNDALKVENTLNGRTMTYDGFGFFDLRVNNQGTIERIKFELPTYKPKGTEDAYTQYTLAALDDIPTKTSELDNDSGFITNVTWGIITDKPTFATVATSGSYNDLTDKPYIFPSSRIVDTDTNQDITGTKTFEGLIKVRDVTHAQTTSIFPNEFDYTLTSPTTNETTRTKFKLPTSKPSGTEQEPTTYTLSTTDDIPTVNNPTITFTQGGTTKGTITLNQSGDQTIEFDAGGSSGGSKLYLHKLHIKKYYLKDTNDKEIAHSLHLYYNITTSSNQPMTLDTYKSYFTGDSTVSDYGFAASGKITIMGNNGGEASVTSLGFTNNNMVTIQYYIFRNSAARNSRIDGKFDSVDGFEDTVTEV